MHEGSSQLGVFGWSGLPWASVLARCATTGAPTTPERGAHNTLLSPPLHTARNGGHQGEGGCGWPGLCKETLRRWFRSTVFENGVGRRTSPGQTVPPLPVFPRRPAFFVSYGARRCCLRLVDLGGGCTRGRVVGVVVVVSRASAPSVGVPRRSGGYGELSFAELQGKGTRQAVHPI